MNSRYKIILSGKNLYKEIELSRDDRQVKIGTALDCDVRLRRDMFFNPIEILLVKNDSDWTIFCSDGIYLTEGDIKKLITKKLFHGDSLEVKYDESDNVVFTLDFLIDFDDGHKKYDRSINVNGVNSITMGGSSSANLWLQSDYVKTDSVVLVRQSNSTFSLDIKKSVYGVYINGKRAKNGSILKSGDFISVSDYFFYFKNNVLLTEIRDDIKISSLSYTDCPLPENYPKFNRNTRVKTVVCDEKIEVLDPPAKPQKPKSNLFMRLLPSMGMLLSAAIMASMGGTMIYMSIVSGAMAILTTVMGIIEGKKDYKKSSEERITKYNAYITKKKEDLSSYRDRERSELEEVYISQQSETARFKSFSSDLFDRSVEDEDFLCVRFGSGSVPSKRIVDYKKQEKLEIEDELQEMPKQLCEEFKDVHNAPIVCDFKSINALGIVGKEEQRYELMKNIVFDIAARHYHADVKMVFVAEQQHKDRIYWLRFLPHVFNEYIGIRNLVTDDESKNYVFEYLYKELTAREQKKSCDEKIVVFFYDEYGFKNHPISKFVSKAKDYGVTFVFFGDTSADIPQGCGYIASITDQSSGLLINTENKGESLVFNYPSLSQEQAESIVKLLAPVYTEEISLESTLTKNISMFELLNILAVDDIDLDSRWATSQVFKSMAAPLGVSKTGVVELDLHDKAHGPHGLVAGTTGSGKSEILQTYILSMATLFHPYEVAFVIIDFKGGGMVNQFKELPHLLGAITNIDGKAINRSLKSIKSELQKRQRLFADADVNHIDKYIKKYKAGEVSSPLPHLIIIVDEFAELKAEQPEFMKELISAARIGRSLGVHLILATQKPSGQVNEQIWSNSRFKLCLKVQSQEDSNEVLKSPLAAEIKEPGRAYLQVGNNEVFELFQSAYSGASEKSSDSNVKEFSIYSLTESGKRVPVYVRKKQKGDSGNATQLDAIVKYVSEHCENKKLTKLPDICLPALPNVLPFESIKGSGDYEICFGKYDAPSMQYQGPITAHLAENNYMIVGSTQTGKTNLLQVLIKGLVMQYSPEEVNIYAIDFGTMILKNYEKLNHVGGVVCVNDSEKLKNLFKLLKGEISKRKEMLLSAGVSSFVSYKEAGKTDMPLIVLMIDNLGLLRELYFSDNDPLLPICREGLSVGISVVVTNAQTSGMGYKYMSNFEGKIAFHCSDSMDYSTLFGQAKIRPDNEAGRCLVEIEKELFDAQVYLAFEGEKEYQRVEKIREFVKEINLKTKAKAVRIPEIPEMLTAKYMKDTYVSRANVWQLGLSYDAIEPVDIDLTSIGTFGIVAKQGAELKNLLDGIVKTAADGDAELYLMDNMNSELAKYSQLQNTVCYARAGGKYCEAVNQIATKLQQRYEQASENESFVLSNEKLIVMLVYGNDFQDAISADRSVLENFKKINSKYKNMRFCFILCGMENSRIPIMGADVLKLIRDNNQLLILEELKTLKVIDLSPSALRKYREERNEHDAYLYSDGDLVKVKIARGAMN